MSPGGATEYTRGRALDLVERVLVLGLYGWLVARIVAAIHRHGASAGNLLLLVSEGLVLVFVLARRRTDDVSRRPLDWLLALSATSSSMFVVVSPASPVPPAVGATVLVTGVVVQLHAKIALGRSFGCVPANRGLRVSGPYRLVRHPMYAGYLLSDVGFALMNPCAWNAWVYAATYVLQIARLLAEERLLDRDDAYARYRAVVRYRLIPGVF
jgi:protein-S-isoprenylcysteine O-methyltransferase Ste14